MKTKLPSILLFLLYFCSLIYSYYIGRWQTIYGVGVFVVIAIQAIGLVSGLVFYLLRNSFAKSLKYASVVAIVLHFLLITTHEISNYKPTYTISIPKNVEGCVYLFTSTEEYQNIEVNDAGIGYIGSKGKAKWKVKWGNEDMPNAFATSQANEIIFYTENDTRMTAYNVMCLDMKPSKEYERGNSDYVIIPCMDEVEFLFMLEKNFIDEPRLRKRVWKGSRTSADWKLDIERSRL